MTRETGSRHDTDDRRGLLNAITPQTRVIALVVLIVEALFVAGSYAIPEEQRITAFIACAVLLVIAIGACVWLELVQRQVQHPSEAIVRLPQELKGNAFWIDPKTQTDKSAGADFYRTASNCKFAGKYQEAIGLYNKVLEIQSDHWKARYNVGSCLCYLGRLREAEVYFQGLVEELKEVAAGEDRTLMEIRHGCYIQLNLVCDRRNDFLKGRDYLLESLKIKPDDALSYLNLVISCIRAGDRQEATKWYRVLLEHPQQLQVLTTLDAEEQRLIDSIEEGRSSS